MRPPLNLYKKGVFGDDAATDVDSELLDFISSALQSKPTPEVSEPQQTTNAVSPNVSSNTENLDLGKINNLLSMYGENLTKQKGLDDTRYKNIEDKVNQQRSFDLSPEKYDEVNKNANAARMIADIFQAANLGGNGAAFKDIGQHNYEAAMEPITKSKYFQDALKGKAKEQIDLGSLQRQNLKDFGGDIENLLQSAKPYEALKIDRDKADPNSNISLSRAMQFNDSMSRLASQLSATPSKYYADLINKSIPDFKKRIGYDETGKMVPGKASYNDAEKMSKELDSAYNVARMLESQDIQRQNAGVKMMITPQQQFDQNKELNKLGDKINSSINLQKLWDEVSTMSQDPEIRSGFGQKTVQQILSQFSDDRSGLTPKQAKFAAKLQIAVSPERHGLMGASMTDSEIREAKEMFPNLNDALPAMSGKISANKDANMGKLRNNVYQHNLLKTNSPFEHEMSDDEVMNYGKSIYVKNRGSKDDKGSEYIKAARSVLSDPNSSKERKEKAKLVLQKYGAK